MIRIILLLTVTIYLHIPVLAQPSADFTGPLSSWANVKTRFKAAGDGKKDDTKAFQSALDGFANHVTGANAGANGYMVLYVPAGIYNISETLRLRGQIGVSIIGEDPDKTIIRWVGKNNDTMFHANGSAYYKLSRVGWNANGRTGMEAVGIHWTERWETNNSRSFAALNIEISDNIFSGKFATGIGGGTYANEGTAHNDSEITIIRCEFRECTDAGIRIKGFNALDYWVWNSLFTDCRIGISSSHGNYHVYQSSFYRSTLADLYNVGGSYISARECFSSGSASFSKDEGSSCNPFKRIFQANTIESPIGVPIEYNHRGNVFLLDNSFSKSSNKDVSRNIILGSWCKGNYLPLSLYNKYSYADPIQLEVPEKRLIKYFDSETLQTPANTVRSSAVKIVRSPNRKSVVYTVPKNAGSKQIQQMVDEVSASKETNPVIHFPYGKYLLTASIVVPPRSTIRFQGDGYIYGSMILQEKSNSPKPLFIVKGPSSVSFSDLHLGANDGNIIKTSVIEFYNVDQPDSRLLLDQIYSSADTSLFVNGLVNLQVKKTNSFFSDGSILIAGKTRNRAQVRLKMETYGGQFAKSNVYNYASIVAKDCWWEGKERVALPIEGNGNITIDGAMIAPQNADSLASITIGRFQGNLTLMNMYMYGGIAKASKNQSMNLLLSNIHFYHTMDPMAFLRNDRLIQCIASGITTQCFGEKPECGQILSVPEFKSGISSESKFLNQMVQNTREAVSKLKPSSASASNIRMERVVLGAYSRAICISK